MSLLGDLNQYAHYDVDTQKGAAVQVTEPLFFASAQILDLANTATTLVMNGVETSTNIIVDSNVLAVDANGGTTVLKLPPEADCNGLMLFILNTGGETITLQNDAAGAILTIATAEHAMVACDGTTWRGFVGVA